MEVLSYLFDSYISLDSYIFKALPSALRGTRRYEHTRRALLLWGHGFGMTQCCTDHNLDWFYLCQCCSPTTQISGIVCRAERIAWKIIHGRLGRRGARYDRWLALLDHENGLANCKLDLTVIAAMLQDGSLARAPRRNSEHLRCRK
jgi:hypothetical protein